MTAKSTTKKTPTKKAIAKKVTAKKSKTAAAKTKEPAVERKHRIYTMTFASVYPHYLKRVETKGRKKAELDTIISWLTGYSSKELKDQLKKETNFETFFAAAPKLNPARAQIKGTICGVRIEEIEDPLMKEVRYLDKLIDELAQGKAMEKILRQ